MNELNSIKDNIKSIYNSIYDKINIINKDMIYQIDIDILLSDIRNLYEQLNQLKSISQNITKLSSNSDTPSHSERSEELIKETIFETKVEEPVYIEQPKEETIEVHEEIKPIVTENPPVEEIVSSLPPVSEKPSKTEKSKEHVITDLFGSDETLTISDKFKDDKQSLNEKLGQKQSQTIIADRINKNTHNDIRNLIGINEKFLFINELFDGVMDNYNEFISMLNILDNHDEVMLYVNDHKNKHSWNINSDAYKKLHELIDKKFS